MLQLLQQLHSENMLGYRFPIGLEEQIKKWDPETIKAFHERWYFPANATLFIVGDIGSVSRTVEMIEVSQTNFPFFLYKYVPIVGVSVHLVYDQTFRAFRTS